MDWTHKKSFFAVLAPAPNGPMVRENADRDSSK